MSNSEAGTTSREPEPGSSYSAPLTAWQRIDAAAAGVALAVGGMVCVFLGKSEAGSVALILGGVAFLIVAVIGLSVHRVKPTPSS